MGEFTTMDFEQQFEQEQEIVSLTYTLADFATTRKSGFK